MEMVVMEARTVLITVMMVLTVLLLPDMVYHLTKLQLLPIMHQLLHTVLQHLVIVHPLHHIVHQPHHIVRLHLLIQHRLHHTVHLFTHR